MVTLGIESSAHTFGVGVVDHGKFLSNKKDMYKISDRGMIPRKVADHHSEVSYAVIKGALADAGISIRDIDSIGYTKGPGIGPCLRIGELAAKTLANNLHIPVYPVNHAIAHIEAAKHLSRFRDPLALYVSGGNSQILGTVALPFKHYTVYGETFDIGIGNMLDNFARAAQLNPAWGSSVAKLAKGGKYIGMPYNVKGMDFTFTGLLTNAIKLLDKANHKDVAFSLQETAFSMLSEATERALMLTSKKELIACGGVAQSIRLAEMLKGMAYMHKVKFYVAPNEYNADNGAMIALVAEKMHMSGIKIKDAECNVLQRYRADSVNITW